MRLLVGMGLLLLAACNAPQGAPDLRRPADLRPDLTDVYPPGPYGNEVGDTIAPLIWEGYVNPTAVGLANSRPYGPYTMNDLRLSGKKYALLYAADFW